MVVSLTQLRRHGGAALPRATVMATTVWLPKVAGDVQLGACCAAAVGADGGVGLPCMRSTASGMDIHCGAERPNRPAKSMAAVSKRSCCPMAR